MASIAQTSDQGQGEIDSQYIYHYLALFPYQTSDRGRCLIGAKWTLDLIFIDTVSSKFEAKRSDMGLLAGRQQAADWLVIPLLIRHVDCFCFATCPSKLVVQKHFRFESGTLSLASSNQPY